MEITREELLGLENKVSTLSKKTGEILFSKWRNSQDFHLKNHREPVTELDVVVEKNIRAELSNILPNAGFIVEEGEDTKKEEFNWTIDPIDQTKNLIGKIPLFCIQMALVHKDIPILGVIFNPVSDQLFSASLGNGAKLNGNPIISKAKSTLKESLIDIDFGGNTSETDWKVLIFKKLTESAYRVRITGGAYSPYLATSGIDGFVVLNQETKIVDQMPRIILARESGLVFESFEFESRKIYIAGNKSLFKEIKKVVQS